MPQIQTIKDSAEIARLDGLLVDELMTAIGNSELSHESFDLYGVDFVFASEGSYGLRCPGIRKEEKFEVLTMGDLKSFITKHAIAREDVLRIKVVFYRDGHKDSRPIKEAVDFIADAERIALVAGRWVRFNQDYLDYLDDYLGGIEVEETEAEFLEVSTKEGVFNASDEVVAQGYECADKDFGVLKTRSSTPVEAWDLKQGNTVYAVKFGTPQKLGYVCDQATAVLEILRNRANVKTIPDFERYCLWLGYSAKRPIGSIVDSQSIILKMKIEAWARKARDLDIVPVIKLSHRIPLTSEAD